MRLIKKAIIEIADGAEFYVDLLARPVALPARVPGLALPPA